MITVVFFKAAVFFHHHAACQAGKYCKQGAGGQWLDIDAPHVPQADRRGWKTNLSVSALKKHGEPRFVV